MKGLSKIVRSVRFALRGIAHAYKSDQSFRLEIHWGIPVYACAGWFLWPMTQTEILFLSLSYFLILIVELINTSFERMLDKVHPEQHELIGYSKDVAASAVLVAFCFSLLVVLVLLVVRLVR